MQRINYQKPLITNISQTLFNTRKIITSVESGNPGKRFGVLSNEIQSRFPQIIGNGVTSPRPTYVQQSQNANGSDGDRHFLIYSAFSFGSDEDTRWLS